MAFKSIFTALTDVKERSPELIYAVAFSEAQDAHLEVMCLGVDPTPNTYFEIGSNAVLMHTAIEQAHARASELKESSRNFLNKTNLRWDVISSMTASASVARTVATQARFNDIAVITQPYGTAAAPECSSVLDGLLFDADCPVIVIPDEKASAKPTSIVVAWNQSGEAMRAVRAALPLLKSAKTVHLAIIDPPDSGPERSDPGGALAVYLSRHDVRCDIQVMTRQGLSISERLAQHVTETGSDMVVMGGYGHSRFREAVLGGATRDMLEKSKVPVLMAH